MTSEASHFLGQSVAACSKWHMSKAKSITPWRTLSESPQYRVSHLCSFADARGTRARPVDFGTWHQIRTETWGRAVEVYAQTVPGQTATPFRRRQCDGSCGQRSLELLEIRTVSCFRWRAVVGRVVCGLALPSDASFRCTIVGSKSTTAAGPQFSPEHNHLQPRGRHGDQGFWW